MKSKLRVLVIAEAANPDMVSVPLVGWSHARALADVVEAHLVTQVRNRDAITAAGWTEGQQFTAIDTERVIARMRRVAKKLRGGPNKGWTLITATQTLAYYAFERKVWKTFGKAIRAGEYDVVHRITPLSPTATSTLAKRCAKAGVPFVLGPLNGGVPWPKGFDSARRKEREWLSYVRGAYKLLPGYRATRKYSAAILAASRDTRAQLPPAVLDKTVFLPENGIDPERFAAPRTRVTRPPIRLISIGRLVPYKGADILLEAVAPLVRAGRVTVDLLGDGPLRPKLEAIIEREGLADGVTLHGWVEHTQVQQTLVEADVMVLPSIREFGGGVVLEAMAMGVVPVVADYGGPAELVTDDTGIRVPMGTRAELVERFRAAVDTLSREHHRIAPMSRACLDRVDRCFTWQVKATQTLEVYRWVTGQRETKPDFGLMSPGKSPADAA